MEGTRQTSSWAGTLPEIWPCCHHTSRTSHPVILVWIRYCALWFLLDCWLVGRLLRRRQSTLSIRRTQGSVPRLWSCDEANEGRVSPDPLLGLGSIKHRWDERSQLLWTPQRACRIETRSPELPSRDRAGADHGRRKMAAWTASSS